LGKLILLLDRTAVLFIGIAVGAVIGLAFLGSNGSRADAEPAAPIVQTSAEATSGPVAGECAVQFNRGLTRSLAAGEPVQIGVFGDSFGDGLWGALYRAFHGEDSFVVHRYARQSTGFTRYRSRNLFDDIRARLEQQPIDIAVVSFGANDTQGIYADGSAAAYMSEDWQEIVGTRVDAIVQMLRDHGAIVYWVGLPTMRRAGFDEQIRQMNRFYKTRMQQLGVPYIETAPLSVDSEGRYAAYLPHPESGTRTLIRANDGIHMTGIGYSFLMRGLVERIRGYVDLARTESLREEGRRDAQRRTPAESQDS
jgi:hypothetical protein